MSTTQGYTLPAPADGIDRISSIDRVPELNALVLENLYPTGPNVAVRRGLLEYAALGKPIETAIAFREPDGTEHLIVGVDKTVQAISGGVKTDITGSTTPSSDQWQGITFNKRLFLCNGEDKVQVWTGASTLTDAAFTGIDTADLINVSSYKERLYFVEKDSASIWYTNEAKKIAGPLIEVPFEYFMKKGGFIVSCGSWSGQTGTLAEDLFYALSSEGELLLYQGSYPGSTSWALVARFVIGRPLGYRAQVQVENDLWFVTSRGIVPMSMLFGGNPSIAANSISRRVNTLIKKSVQVNPFSFLYAPKFWAVGQRIFVPIVKSGRNTNILVCNIETGAWCVYSYAVPGACISLEIFEDEPYFGSQGGQVFQGESGLSDDGRPITFDMRLGYNFFGSRAQFKHFLDVRPIMRTVGAVTLNMTIDTDFSVKNRDDTITTELGLATFWDEFEWDEAGWSDEDRSLYDRYSLVGQGHCGSLRVRGSVVNAPLEFNAFEVRFRPGSQV